MKKLTLKDIGFYALLTVFAIVCFYALKWTYLTKDHITEPLQKITNPFPLAVSLLISLFSAAVVIHLTLQKIDKENQKEKEAAL